jgi:hypothetical protein
MKKLLTTSLVCFALISTAQSDKTWSFGAQWGFQGNHSWFSGGMEEAHAKFHVNSFGGGALNLIARYDENKHWMLMTGLGFNSFGFEYSLTKNYSLRKPEDQSSSVSTQFSSLEIPTLIHYKFNPNCKNAKWVLGLGFVHTLIGLQTITEAYSESTEGALSGEYISSTSQTTKDLACMYRMTVAREKVFKKGGILNVSLVFNLGLKEIATSTVEYEVDQQKYKHEFTNNGNYLGFKLAYFLRPFTKH